jgi:hypothetical protein
MRDGLGPCGVCGHSIPLMTSITTVTVGKRSLLCCKDCPRKQGRLAQLGVYEDMAESNPVVVSDPAVFAASSLKVTDPPKEEEPLPSMPVKEQTGRRRKATKSDDDPAGV